MRSKKELYKVILKSYIKLSEEDPHSGHLFICNHIDLLHRNEIITKKEFHLIFEDFKRNRPSEIQHKNYTKKLYITDGSAWWILSGIDMEEGIKIRIKFLRRLIRLN